jgi:hypothetical protein
VETSGLLDGRKLAGKLRTSSLQQSYLGLEFMVLKIIVLYSGAAA